MNKFSAFLTQAESHPHLWLDLVRIPPSGTWERRRADLYAAAVAIVAPSNLITLLESRRS